MTQLYFRDLQQRLRPLEQHYCPEEVLLPTVVVRDENGLPIWVCVPTIFEWTRHDGEPIPPKILALVDPQVRAAYEARLAAGLEDTDEDG